LYLMSISQYIMVSIMVHIAGFRGAHCDAALQDSVQPPEVQPPVESDEHDPCPVPEDDECFEAPDAQSKEEAINKFLDGIEPDRGPGMQWIQGHSPIS
jgi:hypothetical protein